MKKYFWNIVTVICLGLLVICFFRIVRLKQEVQNLRNNVSNQITSLESNMRSNISYMEGLLEQEASILANAKWKYGAYNREDLSLEVQCEITPKEYHPETTKAWIVFNEQKIPLELSNGQYVKSLQVPLFEESMISQVMFEEDGVFRTETLDWTFSPLYDYIPDIYAYLVGRSSGNVRNGEYLWIHSGTLEVQWMQKGSNAQVKSLTMVRCLDGKSVEQMEIPLDEDNQNFSRSHEVALEYRIPFGSVQELYVDVVDTDGLCYRVLMNHIKIDENGICIEEGEYEEQLQDGYTIIYDQDGKELYRGMR